jgi:hypothetical protein
MAKKYNFFPVSKINQSQNETAKMRLAQPPSLKSHFLSPPYGGCDSKSETDLRLGRRACESQSNFETDAKKRKNIKRK